MFISTANLKVSDILPKDGILYVRQDGTTVGVAEGRLLVACSPPEVNVGGKRVHSFRLGILGTALGKAFVARLLKICPKVRGSLVEVTGADAENVSCRVAGIDAEENTPTERLTRERLGIVGDRWRGRRLLDGGSVVIPRKRLLTMVKAMQDPYGAGLEGLVLLEVGKDVITMSTRFISGQEVIGVSVCRAPNDSESEPSTWLRRLFSRESPKRKSKYVNDEQKK